MSVAEDCTRNLYQTQPEFFDCQNLEECNLRKKRVLIVFDDMIADMKSSDELIPTVTELFLRGRKLKISLVFMSQSYFKVCFF